MRTMNERPVCHRSEDLVTYLYHEASAAEAQDFASHVETCEACRAEFAVLSQVHESILIWRNEALGVAFSPTPQAAPVLAETATDSRQFVRHERKLPALAALREFFSISPLWLRGATAFAALLLCVLAVLVVSRLSQKQNQVVINQAQNSEFSKRQFDAAVAEEVKRQMDQVDSKKPPAPATATKPKLNETSRRTQLASNGAQPRVRGLSRAERVQLAADLRLTPGRDDEELPFVFPDEPNR
jgi:anti-sigma factor RsiW